jgi:hypothetical protein
MFADPVSEHFQGRSVIAGGSNNYVGPNSRTCFIGGGVSNRMATNNAADDASCNVIAGGNNNVMTETVGNCLHFHTIAGGVNNTVMTAYGATISGGSGNTAGADYGNCDYSTIGGGYQNRTAANASYGCIPGGRQNTVGAYSLACGYNAQAYWNGFVFADGTLTSSTRSNQFMIGADGGLTLRCNAGTFDWYNNGSGKWLSTPNTGCYLGSDGVWYSASSREIKHGFTPVNTADILQKVSGMTLDEWRYNATPDTRHIGVMAEDFSTTFGFGDNPVALNPLDVCGVLWAAVQALTVKINALTN